MLGSNDILSVCTLRFHWFAGPHPRRRSLTTLAVALDRPFPCGRHPRLSHPPPPNGHPRGIRIVTPLGPDRLGSRLANKHVHQFCSLIGSPTHNQPINQLRSTGGFIYWSVFACRPPRGAFSAAPCKVGAAGQSWVLTPGVVPGDSKVTNVVRSSKTLSLIRGNTPLCDRFYMHHSFSAHKPSVRQPQLFP